MLFGLFNCLNRHWLLIGQCYSEEPSILVLVFESFSLF
uniref:Uncharacterized protein n=1 Tax=Rhizophora mucronata TaxID=61149 RepID=A0A2P2QGG9_RHIMU